MRPLIYKWELLLSIAWWPGISSLIEILMLHNWQGVRTAWRILQTLVTRTTLPEVRKNLPMYLYLWCFSASDVCLSTSDVCFSTFWSMPILWGSLCKCGHCQKSANHKSLYCALHKLSKLLKYLAQILSPWLVTLHPMWRTSPNLLSLSQSRPLNQVKSYCPLTLPSVPMELACQTAEE